MQTQVEVHVLQGERPMAPDNKTLGKFNLDGIPPARRGMPQIEVTFDIDADGILHVSAKDQATGREQKITITASSGLNKDEVDKMVKEAQKFADEDRKRKEEVEIRNNADSALYQSEKMLRDLGDKVPADVKTEVEAKITALKNVKDSRDPQEVKRKTDELAQTLQKIGERMYQQTGGAGTPPPPGGEPGGQQQGPKGSDTVDGEFREVKD
jgi:molecular chaperone DnaK